MLGSEASDVVLQETDITHSKDSGSVEVRIWYSVGGDGDQRLVEAFSKMREHNAKIAICTTNATVPRSIDQAAKLNERSGNTHRWRPQMAMNPNRQNQRRG